MFSYDTDSPLKVFTICEVKIYIHIDTQHVKSELLCTRVKISIMH